MTRMQLMSDFMRYLASTHGENTLDRLPALNKLSKHLGVSVSVLREQLEVAKALGLVEVRPRTGIRRLAYTFTPAVQQSLGFALELDTRNFIAYADLRNRLESSYWYPAVTSLTHSDHQELQGLVDKAWEKLYDNPIQVPHAEHRQLHLSIFRHLDNPFVWGILEAFWDAYETVGLSVFADYNHLHLAWDYHQKMVDAICAGDFEAGYHALVTHEDLLYHHPLSEAPESSRES